MCRDGRSVLNKSDSRSSQTGRRVRSLRRFLTGLLLKRGQAGNAKEPHAMSLWLPHCRIEASLDWLLTTSYDFDTASTGIQETESLRTKATNRRKDLCERLDQRRLCPLQAVGGENAYAPKHFTHSANQRMAGVNRKRG